MPASRDESGRFVKGQSGNPEGRKPLAPEIRDMLLPLGKKSVAALKKVLEDPDAKDSDKLRATEIVLDRLLGKAAQPIQADVFKSDTPLTLDECFAIAEEVLHEAGGPTAP